MPTARAIRFGIVVGVALLLMGIGLAILALEVFGRLGSDTVTRLSGHIPATLAQPTTSLV